MSPDSPITRLGILALIAGILVSVIAGSAGAAFLALSQVWDSPDRIVQSALTNAITSGFAAMVSVALLLVISKTVKPESFALVVVGSGVARMLIALALTLAAFMLINPEGKSLWTAFLLTNLFALIAETTWGVIMNNRIGARSPDLTGKA